MSRPLREALMIAIQLFFRRVQLHHSGLAVAVGAGARRVGGALGAGYWKSHARLLSLALLLAAFRVPPDVARAQAAGAGAEWTTPAGTVEGTRFSSLAQITTGNVSSSERSSASGRESRPAT